MVDSGTHAAIFTDLDASLLARLPSEIDPVLGSTPVLSSHALTSNAATPVVTDVAVGSETVGVCWSIHTSLAEVSTDFVLDLRSLISAEVLSNLPVFSVTSPGKATSKKKVVSSSKVPRTQKKLSPVFSGVRLKLPSSPGVVKKAISSRSKSFSVGRSTGTQHGRRTFLSSVHYCNAADKVVLLIVSKASKSGGLDAKVSFDDF